MLAIIFGDSLFKISCVVFSIDTYYITFTITQGATIIHVFAIPIQLKLRRLNRIIKRTTETAPWHKKILKNVHRQQLNLFKVSK